MKSKNIRKNIILTLGIGIAFTALFIAGCGDFAAPTASQDNTNSNPEFWTPQPGDQVVAGRDVPIVNAEYWETLYGPQVNPNNQAVSARIGPEGGTLQIGLHSLIVPPGALSEEQEIVFHLNFASLVGVGVDCTPSPMYFNIPVILSLSYSGTQYEGTDNVQLQIVFMDDDGLTDPLPTVIDEDACTATAELNHFSRYILG